MKYKILHKLILFGLIILTFSRLSAQESYVWFVSSTGGSGNGKIIRLGNKRDVIAPFSFSGAINNVGRLPVGSLVQPLMNNEKLYGVTMAGGSVDKGVLYSVDPYSLTYNVVLNFEIPERGLVPIGGVSVGRDQWLYGVTKEGGEKNLGVIFRYNTMTLKYEVLHHFNTYAPKGKLTLHSNGKFYGFTYNSLFELDPEKLTVKTMKSYTYQKDNTGYLPYLYEDQNGKFWFGNASGYGSAHTYDPKTNTLGTAFTLTKTTGYGLKGGVVQAPNGNYYVFTQVGGTYDMGTVVEFNPSTGLSVVANSTSPGAFGQPIVLASGNVATIGHGAFPGNFSHDYLFSYYDFSTSKFVRSFYENTGEYTGDLGGFNESSVQGNIIYASTCKEYESPGGSQLWNTTGIYHEVVNNGSNVLMTVVLDINKISGDANCNGQIDGNEISGDVDGDGKISGNEIAGDIDGNFVIDSLEYIGDINGDGKISNFEMSGDVNGNGLIDNKEVLGEILSPNMVLYRAAFADQKDLYAVKVDEFTSERFVTLSVTLVNNLPELNHGDLNINFVFNHHGYEYTDSVSIAGGVLQQDEIGISRTFDLMFDDEDLEISVYLEAEENSSLKYKYKEYKVVVDTTGQSSTVVHTALNNEEPVVYPFLENNTINVFYPETLQGTVTLGQLHDMNGRMIHSSLMKATDKNEIQIRGGLPDGIYIYQIKLGNNMTYAYKIINR